MKATQKLLIRTTASVCAVVLLLCAVPTGKLFAQEADTSAASTTPEVPASTGYTTEMVGSPSDAVPGDFVVGPGKVELTIEPGQSKTIELMVTNRTGIDRDFNLEVEDAAGSYNTNTPVVLLGDDRGPYTLKDYLSFPVQKIHLAHNERARIPVTVSIPANAEAGGRYGSVLVNTVTRDAEVSNESGATPSSAIVTRVGTLFFIKIPGNIKTEGSLNKFSTVPERMFFTDGPINFQVLYENKGDIHLNPYGEMRITNLFNEEVGYVELDPWFAMPKSLRSREVSWDREMLIGRYTATLNLNRGYDDLIDTQSVTFWVLPWKLVLPVFLGLFLFFFIIRFFIKNFEFKRKTK
jgi:hypothetical protein